MGGGDWKALPLVQPADLLLAREKIRRVGAFPPTIHLAVRQRLVVLEGVRTESDSAGLTEEEEGVEADSGAAAVPPTEMGTPSAVLHSPSQ